MYDVYRVEIIIYIINFDATFIQSDTMNTSHHNTLEYENNEMPVTSDTINVSPKQLPSAKDREGTQPPGTSITRNQHYCNCNFYMHTAQ